MDNVTKEYLKRQIALLRAAEGDAIAFSGILDKILARVTNLVGIKYSPDMTAKSVEKLLGEVSTLIKPFYTDAFKTELFQISEIVAASEIAFNVKTFSSLVGVDANKIVKPALKTAIKTINKAEISGKTFNDWIDRSFLGYRSQVKSIINDGILEGESIAETVFKIKNLNAGSVRDTKAIVRSYTMGVAAESRKQIAALNPDIVGGWVWNSTLDYRTTWDICGVRDQLRYTLDYKPIGHSLPWLAGAGRIHFNCRSIAIPIIRGVNSEYSRPYVGAGDNYERGDNLTRNGTVRKPTKPNRDKEIFEIKRVTTLTRYEGFLKAEAKKNIDFVADILKSKEDAILLRDGKTTLLELAKTNPAFNPTNRNQL